jgi:DNA (cytosine-5)-methyltransferase 1
MNVPVIDLFAGPGGLGEGFSKAKGAQFHIAVSIEKDPMAHQTLRLRAAHRYLLRAAGVDSPVWKTWDDIIASAPWTQTFEALKLSGGPEIATACNHAAVETWNLEMGPGNRDEVVQGIRGRLARLGVRGQRPKRLVLIGGPPCQAYSVVGRSRNRGNENYVPEHDNRHFLYKEYLNVIAEFEPALFVMENVKGILTSRVSDRHLFESIQWDLRRPGMAVGRHLAGAAEYVLEALPVTADGSQFPGPSDFIVRAEEFGVPQARHRVIICGIRKDIHERSGGLRNLSPAPAPCVRDVLNGLPRLRPQLSHRGKDLAWEDSFKIDLFDSAVQELERMPGSAKHVAARMRSVRSMILGGQGVTSTGSDRWRMDHGPGRTAALADWYQDRMCTVLANHESRAHMPSDLLRYLFLSAWGEVHVESPKLKHFPRSLLPNHENVKGASLEVAPFKDRFRVQVGSIHGMTVTSHICKDGHAFIHHDPEQCRSLTVREAARLQTFPDSYVFLGNRTSQYTQVGNAVPPYLALQIAELVADVLQRGR